jgi:hypothetical protein
VADNSRFLARAAQERHQRCVERVLDVLRSFDRDGVPITFVGVATAASVSRSWLYREPTLRAEVIRRRTSAPGSPAPLVPAAQRISATSQRQRTDSLNEEIRWLRQDNARLRAQLERSLGEQRAMKPTNGPTATIPTVGDMSPTQTS